MKNKLFTLAVAVIIGLTAFTQTAEAASNQQRFAQLRAQLLTLPVGSPRLVSIARRMTRLVPSAALQVAVLATSAAGNATQLNQALGVILSQVGIASPRLLSSAQKETLLVRVAIGVRELAPTNGRVLESVGGDTAALSNGINTTSVNNINALLENPRSNLTEPDGFAAIEEILGSDGEPVPYGA